MTTDITDMTNVVVPSIITPSDNDLKTYFFVVFGYLDGLIPMRSFAEKNNKNSRPIDNIWVQADDDIVKEALQFANLANQVQAAFYVIPGVVEQIGKARSCDILQMQTLLIDIDDGNTEEKLTLLEQALGAATLIVESGGTTEEGHKKLHIYWQLVRGVSGNDLQYLLKLRHHIALSVGGDTHFKSAHQPIRVAGSVYHKNGECRLVKIRSYNPVEYELGELIEGARSLTAINDDITVVKASKKENKATTSLSTSPSTGMSFGNLLTTKVHEGGNGEQTRFNHLTKVIGYWLRRCHDGLISEANAFEEIQSYNLANVLPPWPHDRLKQSVEGLWRLHTEKYGEAKKQRFDTTLPKNIPIIKSCNLGSFLSDHTDLPKDIIAPRILTPSGMFVFGGAPKVGKSDFLLSLFVHLAAGKEFLGFIPPRPLKIFYFQAEIGYHYLRERLQKMQLTNELIELAKDNLYITPNTRLTLDETVIDALAQHIPQKIQDKPDIIAVDPIRNVFDGGRIGATENENDAMLFFLQKRIEALRDKVNPDAGIILVHHTKKITRMQFEEDPFQAFSGASSLRGYYTTGALLYKPDIESKDRQLIFELRNGDEIPTKIINKQNGQWIEENALNRPIINKKYSVKLDAERDRRDQRILEILKEEAAKGRAYSINAFCEAFDGEAWLGSKDSIKARLQVLIRKGYIKFFKNTADYGFGKCTSTYGLMCFKDMQLLSAYGEMINVVATHYVHHELEEFLPIENPEIWTIY